MKKSKSEILLTISIFLSIIGTILIYTKLPDQIPTHWGIDGTVDNYSSKGFIYFTALLPVILYIIMKFIPKIDPRRESYKKHGNAYKITILGAITFLIGIHWMTIGYSLGYTIDITKYVMISLGILFILMGNFMPQIRFNYFFGIRTPWTLASEIVWRKTHMLGGYLYFVNGAIFIISSLFNNSMSFYISMGSIILTSLFLLLYSYGIYRREITETKN